MKSIIFIFVSLLIVLGAHGAGNAPDNERNLDVEYVVRATTLEIFEKASVESRVIGTLKCGDNPHVVVNDLDIPMYKVLLSNGKFGYICSAGTRVAGELPSQYTDSSPQEYDEYVKEAKAFMKSDLTVKNSKEGYYTEEGSKYVDKEYNDGLDNAVSLKEKTSNTVSGTSLADVLTNCIKWLCIISLVLIFFIAIKSEYGRRRSGFLSKGLIALGILEVAYALLLHPHSRGLFSYEVFIVLNIILLYKVRKARWYKNHLQGSCQISMLLLVVCAGIGIYRLGFSNLVSNLIDGIINLIVGAIVLTAIYGTFKDGLDGPMRNAEDEWEAEADINGHRVSLRDIGAGMMRGNDGKQYRKGPGGTIQEDI